MYSVRFHYYSKYENQNILTPNQVAPKPNDLVIFILASARPQIPSCLIENRTRLDSQKGWGTQGKAQLRKTERLKVRLRQSWGGHHPGDNRDCDPVRIV